MSAVEAWHSANSDYLSAALAWLRMRLARIADVAQPEPGRGDPESIEEVRARSVQAGVSGGTRAGVVQPMHRPAPVSGVRADLLAEAQERLDRLAQSEPAPALIGLTQRLGLTEFERNVLLLCIGMELDTRVAQLCAQAQGDPGRAYPTFALALALFDNVEWQALSPERPLRYLRLIEINQPGVLPLTASALRVDERILSAVKGLDYLDDRLTPYLVAMPGHPADSVLPSSQEAAAGEIVHHLAAAGGGARATVVQLVGPDASGMRSVVARACGMLGLHVLRLPQELLPTLADEVEAFSRLWHREGLLLPVTLCVDVHDIERGGAADSTVALVARLALRNAGLLFVCAREPLTGCLDRALTIEVVRPSAAEQALAWRDALGAAGEEIAFDLAAQFTLDFDRMRDVARSLEAHTGVDGPAAGRAAWDACVASTRPRLDQLAQRIDAKAGWDDLVLADEAAGLLRRWDPLESTCRHASLSIL